MGAGVAKKANRGKQASEIEADLAERRRWHAFQYGIRHPERARSERSLRKAHSEMLKRWGHKRNGTPETHEKASRTQQGSLARMYQRGGINIEQLASAHMIASVAATIGRDMGLRTISLETRVDGGDGRSGVFYEALGAVRAEMAYSAWRRRLERPAVVLDMIVGDDGLTRTASRYRMTPRRAKRMLIEALDLWPDMHDMARRNCDEGDLVAMHAGLMM